MAEIKQRINTLDNYNVRVGQRLADLAKSIEAGNSDRLKDQVILHKQLCRNCLGS